MNQLRVRQNGEKVLLVLDGKLVAELPWEAALQMGQALISVGKRAEEYGAYRDGSILRDQAILMRAGSFLGIVHDPKARLDAFKEAQWSRELRRYMRKAPGVESSEAVGTPTIRNVGKAK